MKKEWFASWFDTSYYHTLYKNRNDVEAQDFINHLAGQLNLDKNASVLDLACGAGRHAKMLKQHYNKVLGVDLSENSIASANESKIPGLSFQVHDMREEIPNKKFDAIFNLFTSFGYFNDIQDNLKMLTSINKMLNSKGVLVIDFMNANKVVKNLVGSELKTVDGIDFNITRTYTDQKIYKNIKFNADNQNWDFTEQVQALMLSDFKTLLEKSNFEIINFYGDFELRTFDENNSDRLIIIAKKK